MTNSPPPTPRNGPGRRAADVERWLANKWTRRLAALLGFVMLPMGGWYANTIAAWYQRVPTADWKATVDDHVIRGDRSIQDLQLLTQRVTRMENVLKEQHEETIQGQRDIRVEVNQLHSDLQRWFQGKR